jgi:hypothetical protein
MEPRVQFAKTSDGVNIAYAVFGEGPAVVFTARPGVTCTRRSEAGQVVSP